MFMIPLRTPPKRRGVILLVVLVLLTLFSLLGLAFVLLADSFATSARLAREAEAAMEGNAETLPAWNQAAMSTRLEELYVRLDRREKGIYCLERAASGWRSLKAPAALEKRRAGELRRIEALLAAKN